MNERNPALTAFIYVAVCFALIGQMFGLAAIGGLTAGDYGALGGGFAGFFIILWITCWFMVS